MPGVLACLCTCITTLGIMSSSSSTTSLLAPYCRFGFWSILPALDQGFPCYIDGYDPQAHAYPLVRYEWRFGGLLFWRLIIDNLEIDIVVIILGHGYRENTPIIASLRSTRLLPQQLPFLDHGRILLVAMYVIVWLGIDITDGHPYLHSLNQECN